MATFSKVKFSGSTNGRPIKTVAVATPGTLIHTAGADLDEIWLYACNTGGASAKLTIEFGGVTSPDDLIEVGIAGETGLVQVIPGVPVDGSVVVRAFADIANVINVLGWVNRITP